MRQVREMTDEKRLAFVEEYLSSQVAVTDMKKDPDKEQLLQEIDRLK